ncbi:uncharacterized protein N7500_007833 [Penicillium coprophilum]|uniref:uncharacterized protein n=1 Tax=Penicillium coprophilum TaxID=36646 RepID=UPI002398562D|nr:uncharacterized protein N7500_007833 [Penicillium coprophilum]KAJ5158182.1 hypothetical protein N7500_007833 [Penicillium coprophilum]
MAHVTVAMAEIQCRHFRDSGAKLLKDAEFSGGPPADPPTSKLIRGKIIQTRFGTDTVPPLVFYQSLIRQVLQSRLTRLTPQSSISMAWGVERAVLQRDASAACFLKTIGYRGVGSIEDHMFHTPNIPATSGSR